MKAPDKINLPHKNGKIVGLIQDDGLPFRDADGNIEYIRKDALLEWAKETKAEIERENVIKDDIRKGAIWELEEIIEKINSL